MLLYGVIARTQKSFGGLPILAELTHHQLIVATSLASERVLFFTGLLHDVLKPLLKFVKGKKGWSWLHLDGLNGGGVKANLEKILGQSLRTILSENEFESLVQLIRQHHEEDVKYNPIRYAESEKGLGIAIIEATLIPSKDLKDMGLYTCIEAKGLTHSYHFFVLKLIYQGIKYYLNKVYDEIFSSLGIARLIVEYNFGSEKLPEIQYDDKKLSLLLRYYVPSSIYNGLKVVHEYGGNIFFNIEEAEAGHIKIQHAWSDVLTFLIPSPSTNGLIYKILCVIPGIIGYNGKNTSTIEDAKSSFESKVQNILKSVLVDIQESIKLDRNYNEDLLNYVEGEEQGSARCIFCGKGTDRKIKLSQKRLLSEKFTDYHRIRIGESVCPLCHIGFQYEELLREQGPAFYLSLPCEVSSVEVADDFKQRYMMYGEYPLNPEEGMAFSILGLSTMQLMSEAWYSSLLKEVNKRSSSLPTWIRLYTLRNQKDIEELYVKFLINRRVVIYPLIVKIRPKALISSYGGKKKKFVLNTEILEGHTLWRGSELDITEEHLDALEPLTNTFKSFSYKKVYGTLVKLYGLRE
ncbi:hypothetical protein [Thermosphaera sp.]